MNDAPTELQRQAGRDFLNLMTRRRAEHEVKIVKFVRQNPGATNHEVFKATGLAATRAERFVRPKKREDGKWGYYVDEERIERFFQ